jgi:hypothetical protein
MSLTHTSAKQRRVDSAPRVESMFHQQFSGVELLFSIYANRHARCSLRPKHRVNAGSTMRACFDVDPEQYYFKGALLYKLRRKCTKRIDNWPNSSNASIKDTTTNIYLLTA